MKLLVIWIFLIFQQSRIIYGSKNADKLFRLALNNCSVYNKNETCNIHFSSKYVCFWQFDVCVFVNLVDKGSL